MNDRESKLMIQVLRNVLQYNEAVKDGNYDKEMLTKKWEGTIKDVEYTLGNVSRYTSFQKVISHLTALALVVALTWFIVFIVSNIIRTITNV